MSPEDTIKALLLKQQEYSYNQFIKYEGSGYGDMWLGSYRAYKELLWRMFLHQPLKLRKPGEPADDRLNYLFHNRKEKK